MKIHNTHSPGADPLPDASLRVGFDLVQVRDIEDSIAQFGDRYCRRVFTTEELEYASRGEAVRAERLAARFAAKEAVIKALQLSHTGIGWRDIEVVKHDGGDCSVALHGRAAQQAAAMGVRRIALSLSHEGGYAGAMVAVTFMRHDAAHTSIPS